MAKFDPSLTGSAEDGIFGLPYSPEEAKLHLLPVPWEVTTSYGDGTSQGPEVIRQASPQIDLFDIDFGKAYEVGYYMHEMPDDLVKLNDQLKPLAHKIRDELEESHTLAKGSHVHLEKINEGCAYMTEVVYQKSKEILEQGKWLGLIGGDHSSPEGGIRAISEYTASKSKEAWGLLHIDAHADLRKAYQGYKHSHASIMYNVMNADWKPDHLVQVGIRDFCEEEYEMTQSRKDIDCFFDGTVKDELFAGKTWAEMCQHIIQPLPHQVYVSFDIDGLSPHLCPNTGTPVPGGLSFEEVNFLLKTLVHSGRKIIGFDLNEVAQGPDKSEWDGNIGARVLYKLCGWMVKSHG